MRTIIIIAALLINTITVYAQQSTPASHSKKDTLAEPAGYKWQGFTSATTLGLFCLLEDGAGFGFENSSGYRFNSHLSLCGAAGVDILPDFIMVPVSINPRFDLSKGRFTNYVNSNLGYTITANTDYKGIFLGIDLGHKYYIRYNKALLFSLDIRYFLKPNAGAVIFKTGFQFR